MPRVHEKQPESEPLSPQEFHTAKATLQGVLAIAGALYAVGFFLWRAHCSRYRIPWAPIDTIDAVVAGAAFLFFTLASSGWGHYGRRQFKRDARGPVRFVFVLVLWALVLTGLMWSHFWVFWGDTRIAGLSLYCAGMSAFGFLISPDQPVLRIARPRLNEGILFVGALLTSATLYCMVAFPYVPRALGGAKAELLYRVQGPDRRWNAGYPMNASAVECAPAPGSDGDRRRACVFSVFDAADFVVVATVERPNCEPLFPPLLASNACYTMLSRERFAENVRGYLPND
jgi:hypothetical protein